MGREQGTHVEPAHVEAYLRRAGWPDAEVTAFSPLGQRTQEGLKAYGYGRPLRVSFRAGGAVHDVVIRTMSPDPFGHDRRADRAEALLDAFDTFNQVPRHIRALDAGAFAEDGALVPMAHGELFLVTSYVEGELYARDLQEMSALEQARPLDLARAAALGRYLAELHAEPAAPERYRRALRDTIAGGEGIFGLCDSYPATLATVPPARLEAIEHAAVRWRWRMREQSGRARRTHGDFHPFNLLFREGEDLSVLDCSRGGAGEPADDTSCLAVNYLFFALRKRARFDGPLRACWDTFWTTYLHATGDHAQLALVAPFFAWRCLVLASPVWYPDVPDALRDRMLSFAERLLAGAPFTPAGVDELLR